VEQEENDSRRHKQRSWPLRLQGKAVEQAESRCWQIEQA
jgi:hypothetical protein